jgi:predicted phage terminase large subunit-like protein
VLERMHADVLIDRIFDLVKQYDAKRVAIEDEAAQKSFYHWLRREMGNRGTFFQALPIRIPRGVGRYARFWSLQPFVHGGQILFSQDMLGKQDMIDEIETFPKGQHDDLMSALTLVPYSTRFPEKSKIPEPEKETTVANDFWERMLRRTKRNGSRIPRLRFGGGRR